MAQTLWFWMYVKERQLISAWIPASRFLPEVPALTSFRDVQILLKLNKHFPLQVAFDYGVITPSESKSGAGEWDIALMDWIIWIWRCLRYTDVERGANKWGLTFEVSKRNHTIIFIKEQLLPLIWCYSISCG